MTMLDLANVMVIPSNQAGRVHPAVDSIDRNRECLSIHGDDLEKIHLSVSRQNTLTLTMYARHTCSVGQTGIKHTHNPQHSSNTESYSSMDQCATTENRRQASARTKLRSSITSSSPSCPDEPILMAYHVLSHQ